MFCFARVAPTKLDYVADDGVFQIEVELEFRDLVSAHVVQFLVDQNKGGKNERHVDHYLDAIEVA